MGRVKIVKAVQTCFACPSQWDAWTDTGEYVYLRYRGGGGYAKTYEDPDNWITNGEPGTVIAQFAHGHPLDGYITLEHFCELADLELDLE